MLTKTAVESLKMLLPSLVDMLPGTAFSITDREQITEIFINPDFKLNFFEVGMKLDTWGDRGSIKAIRTGVVQTDILVTVIFGSRLFMRNFPFVDDNGEISGTFNIVAVRNHAIANAFTDFAPMIAEMFPEGAGLYMTDNREIVNRQGSSKFDLSDIYIGKILSEDSAAMEAIRNKNMVAYNLPQEIYGVPVLNVCYPLFDDQDRNQVIGCFGIATPKETTHSLQDISENLNRSLEEIAAVVEELAASASEIMTNQQSLDMMVSEVSGFIVNINEILSLIIQIADETKMLGLNAAIESARAGEAGAGFGVVASEIRKLSGQSKETVEKIRNLTENIGNSVEQTIINSQRNMKASEDQAAATQQVSAGIQDIAAMARKLTAIAQILR